MALPGRLSLALLLLCAVTLIDGRALQWRFLKDIQTFFEQNEGNELKESSLSYSTKEKLSNIGKRLAAIIAADSGIGYLKGRPSTEIVEIFLLN